MDFHRSRLGLSGRARAGARRARSIFRSRFGRRHHRLMRAGQTRARGRRFAHPCPHLRARLGSSRRARRPIPAGSAAAAAATTTTTTPRERRRGQGGCCSPAHSVRGRPRCAGRVVLPRPSKSPLQRVRARLVPRPLSLLAHASRPLPRGRSRQAARTRPLLEPRATHVRGEYVQPRAIHASRRSPFAGGAAAACSSVLRGTRARGTAPRRLTRTGARPALSPSRCAQASLSAPPSRAKPPRASASPPGCSSESTHRPSKRTHVPGGRSEAALSDRAASLPASSSPGLRPPSRCSRREGAAAARRRARGLPSAPSPHVENTVGVGRELFVLRAPLDRQAQRARSHRLLATFKQRAASSAAVLQSPLLCPSPIPPLIPRGTDAYLRRRGLPSPSSLSKRDDPCRGGRRA